MAETRPLLTDPEVLEALAHPVRLDVLQYLISNGPATASACARAVGDSPSNCSYHLRVLARTGLVTPADARDGRERPWQAMITGFEIEPDADPASAAGRGADAVRAASLALDQRRLRDYLTHRDQTTPAWRRADLYSTYVIRVTPAQLAALGRELDALIRPLIAIEGEATDGAQLVQLGLHAFPRDGWQ
ncbi:MAG TPA: helix-turn-helix domain-containing protein [Solirubrobacteraceae bacterium]|jgi:DNA-binding transcriptional ArsR family regulator